jgi:hypothetical protein
MKKMECCEYGTWTRRILSDRKSEEEVELGRIDFLLHQQNLPKIKK